MGTIYRIINTKTGKCYVGKTTRDVNERFRQHLRVAQRIDTYLYRAIKKYGPDSFVVEALLECADGELDAREKEFIDKFSSVVPFGYNMTAGGEGGDTSKSPKYKEGMQRLRDGGFRRGANNSMYGIGGMLGKRHTIETKRKQSEARKKYWDSLSVDERTNRKTCRGANNPRYGKTPSNAIRPTINGVTYSSLTECSRKTGMGIKMIKAVMNGKALGRTI